LIFNLDAIVMPNSAQIIRISFSFPADIFRGSSANSATSSQ